jgi:hypothetical protein
MIHNQITYLITGIFIGMAFISFWVAWTIKKGIITINKKK